MDISGGAFGRVHQQRRSAFDAGGSCVQVTGPAEEVCHLQRLKRLQSTPSLVQHQCRAQGEGAEKDVHPWASDVVEAQHSVAGAHPECLALDQKCAKQEARRAVEDGAGRLVAGRCGQQQCVLRSHPGGRTGGTGQGEGAFQVVVAGVGEGNPDSRSPVDEHRFDTA
jgi:hypothetical protein